jgi:4'-phosphopantetheinyl transferase
MTPHPSTSTRPLEVRPGKPPGSTRASGTASARPVQPANGEVHIWSVGLGAPRETVAGLLATLSLEERERAARLRADHDRRRFIVAHGALRGVLAHYLGISPSTIGFVRRGSGASALGPEWGDRLRFSLADSGELALVAVALDADVGVDVERVRAHRDWAEIAHGYFSAAEREQLQSLPNHRRAVAFVRCWTRNEAFRKALGDSPAGPSASGSGDVAETRTWSIHTLRPAPGYIGALAIEGSGSRLRYRRWPGLRSTFSD